VSGSPQERALQSYLANAKSVVDLHFVTVWDMNKQHCSMLLIMTPELDFTHLDGGRAQRTQRNRGSPEWWSL